MPLCRQVRVSLLAQEEQGGGDGGQRRRTAQHGALCSLARLSVHFGGWFHNVPWRAAWTDKLNCTTHGSRQPCAVQFSLFLPRAVVYGTNAGIDANPMPTAREGAIVCPASVLADALRLVLRLVCACPRPVCRARRSCTCCRTACAPPPHSSSPSSSSATYPSPPPSSTGAPCPPPRGALGVLVLPRGRAARAEGQAAAARRGGAQHWVTREAVACV